MSKLSEAKEHYKKLKADRADKSLIKAAKKQYKALKKLKGTENGDESTTPSTKRQRSEETNASPPPAKKNKDQQTCAQNNNSTAQCIACNMHTAMINVQISFLFFTAMHKLICILLYSSTNPLWRNNAL